MRIHSVLDPAGYEEAREAAVRDLQNIFYGAKRHAVQSVTPLVDKLKNDILASIPTSSAEVLNLADAVDRLASVLEKLAKAEAASAIAPSLGSASRVVVAFENDPYQ